ncbi:hypothetical protein BH09ACT11_BH09ACT11_08590 [soil metagenome]
MGEDEDPVEVAPGEFDRIDVEPLNDVASKAAARRRMTDVTSHVEASITQAQRRGEFDNLPGAGKPIQSLGAEHDPDWWIKQLVEREQIAVLPPSIQLRKDDSALDALIDSMSSETSVRQAVEEFNARVIAARYSLPVGPPLITMPRDVDETIRAWSLRRAAARRNAASRPPERTSQPGRAWWRRNWWRRS